jgi:hypothetical protein
MQPGDKYGAPGQKIVEIKTEGGHTFKIHEAAADSFKRTIEDLEKAGAPLGNIGGYSPRPGGIGGGGRMSQHSMGNAMDIFSQSRRDVISPAGRQWIESHPNEFRQILDKNGMLSGGDWKNPDLGHIEWAGRKPWLENQEDKPAAQEQPKEAPKAHEAEQAKPEAVKPPPGPQSYKVDMPGILKVIREKKMGAALVSDDYIRGEIRKGIAKDHPSVKFDNSTITGDKAELDKIKAGFNTELGTDVSNYIRPIEAQQPKTIPVPVRSADPAVERLKAERDKAKKDLHRIKKKQKAENNDKLEDAGGEDAPPPKDNTRSDRALFNINPQLHQDHYPQ